MCGALSTFSDVALLVETVSPDFYASDSTTVLKIGEEFATPNIESFDIIILRYFDSSALAAATKLAKKGACWLVYDQYPVGSSLPLLLMQRVLSIHRRILRRPKKRISPNSRENRAIPGWLDEANLLFQHPGPRPRTNSLVAASLSPQHTVVMIGKKFDSRKKLDLGLKALSRVNKPLNIVIIQSTPEFNSRRAPSSMGIRYASRIEKLARSSKHSVRLVEDLPQEAVLEVFEKSDIYLLPSNREPFSISNIEACSRGCTSILRKTNGSFFAIPNEGRVGIPRFVSAAKLAGLVSSHLPRLEERAEKKQAVSSAYAQFMELRGNALKKIVVTG